MLKLKPREQAIILIIVVVVLLSIVFKIASPKPRTVFHEDPIALVKDKEESQSIVVVHVAGEINNPGIYSLKEGSRVNDAIIKAGGATENGDINKLNLASVIEDGQKITIPKKNIDFQGNTNIENLTMGNKVNINFASQEQLEKLPGIGPAKAKAIISYREKNGLFKSIQELKKVNGIGEKTLEMILEDIEI